MKGYKVQLKDEVLYCENREYFPQGYVTLTNVYRIVSYQIETKSKELIINYFIKFNNLPYDSYNIEFYSNSIEIPIDKVYNISQKDFESKTSEEFIETETKVLNKVIRKGNYNQLRNFINYVNEYRKNNKKFYLFKMDEMSFEEKKELMKFYIENKNCNNVFTYNSLRKNLKIELYISDIWNIHYD